MPFENIVGIGENAGNLHFLLFPQCFLIYQEENLSATFDFFFFLSANLVKSKMLSFGKELTLQQNCDDKF